jgi:hypothetical protein
MRTGTPAAAAPQDELVTTITEAWYLLDVGPCLLTVSESRRRNQEERGPALVHCVHSGEAHDCVHVKPRSVIRTLFLNSSVLFLC